MREDEDLAGGREDCRDAPGVRRGGGAAREIVISFEHYHYYFPVLVRSGISLQPLVSGETLEQKGSHFPEERQEKSTLTLLRFFFSSFLVKGGHRSQIKNGDRLGLWDSNHRPSSK